MSPARVLRGLLSLPILIALLSACAGQVQPPDSGAVPPTPVTGAPPLEMQLPPPPEAPAVAAPRYRPGGEPPQHEQQAEPIFRKSE